jgi:hypothetical protein
LDELNSGGHDVNLNGVNQTNDTLYELPEGMMGPVRLTDEEIANRMTNAGNKVKENIDFIKENGNISVNTARQFLSEAGIDPTGQFLSELDWKQLKQRQPQSPFVDGIESYNDYVNFHTIMLLEQAL